MLRLTLFPFIETQGDMLTPVLTISPLSKLTFSRDYRVFEQIQGFPDCERTSKIDRVFTKGVPEGFTLGLFNDEGQVLVTRDVYGPLRYATAKDFADLQIPDDTESPNHAIKAFLDALPPETVIVLYWN